MLSFVESNPTATNFSNAFCLNCNIWIKFKHRFWKSLVLGVAALA